MLGVLPLRLPSKQKFLTRIGKACANPEGSSFANPNRLRALGTSEEPRHTLLSVVSHFWSTNVSLTGRVLKQRLRYKPLVDILLSSRLQLMNSLAQWV